MLADHPALGQERPDIAVDSACWHPPAADGIRKPCAPANNIQRHDSWFPSRGLTVSRNATFPTPAGSPQVVPDPTTTAVLIQNAALNQRPEVLLQRIATGARQLDDFAHSDTAMLSGKLDNLQ